MPFAAFFVAFLLLLCIPRRSRKLAVCLLLGALAGLCAVHTTSARLERTRANYAGRTVLLTAEVERPNRSAARANEPASMPRAKLRRASMSRLVRRMAIIPNFRIINPE